MILIFDGDKCTGCHRCELACSMTRYGEYNISKSKIKIIQNSELDVNIAIIDITCNGSCPECVKQCLPRAIKFVSIEEAAVLRKKQSVGMFPSPLMAKYNEEK